MTPQETNIATRLAQLHEQLCGDFPAQASTVLDGLNQLAIDLSTYINEQEPQADPAEPDDLPGGP